MSTSLMPTPRTLSREGGLCEVIVGRDGDRPREVALRSLL